MNECKIVQDLLPLYAEDLVSAETREFVEEHCTGCESCDKLRSRAVQPLMEASIDPDAMRKAMQRDVLKRSLKGAILVVMVLAIICTILALGDGGTEEQKYFPSHDGVHSIAFQRWNGVFGIAASHEIATTSRNARGRSGTAFSNWQDLLAVDWSPNGCNALMTIQMTDGSVEMQLRLREYGENYSRSYFYPMYEGWKEEFLDDALGKLLREQEDFPKNWETIELTFEAWQTDEELVFTYTLDGGKSGAGSVILHYPTETVQVFPASP